MQDAHKDSPEAALDAYVAGTDPTSKGVRDRTSPCDTQFRTLGIGIRNHSSWQVEIAFFQLTSVAPPRPGYTQNTGVFRGCQNVPAGQDCGVDPCLGMVAPNLPIIGTTAKGSVNLKKGNQTISR